METIKNNQLHNTPLTFKTNINCSGCVAKITPILNETKGIDNWAVDTDNPNKILSVISNGITEKEVIDKVESAGFKIESINS